MVWKQGDFILGAILLRWKWGPYADPDQQGDINIGGLLWADFGLKHTNYVIVCCGRNFQYTTALKSIVIGLGTKGQLRVS